ncbi:hypothetical protein Q4485_05770 [Granulosicoccaceae sp. 1_MG-2023]|nr:hypothetical protein [Granulosicoccaceae sp. 1_MG-2023]
MPEAELLARLKQKAAQDRELFRRRGDTVRELWVARAFLQHCFGRRQNTHCYKAANCEPADIIVLPGLHAEYAVQRFVPLQIKEVGQAGGKPGRERLRLYERILEARTVDEVLQQHRPRASRLLSDFSSRLASELAKYAEHYGTISRQINLVLYLNFPQVRFRRKHVPMPSLAPLAGQFRSVGVLTDDCVFMLKRPLPPTDKSKREHFGIVDAGKARDFLGYDVSAGFFPSPGVFTGEPLWLIDAG